MSSADVERKTLVEIGRRLWLKGYVAANDGNLSVRLGDDNILVTPTGVSKGFLDPSGLVVVSGRGEVVEGELEPTSELGLHLAAYETRPDVRAVVHAHPPAATAYAVSGIPLETCFLPELIVLLGEVPTAPYGTPSTEELVVAVSPYLARHDAVLLENHGVATLGTDIESAYFRMETVEHAAEIALRARALGGPNTLSAERVAQLKRLFKDRE